MKTKLLIIFILAATIGGAKLTAKNTSHPTKGQRAMIERKYGMFLHYGMNTYLNQEWSDGSADPSVFAAPSDIGKKAAKWVKNAYEAGMRSIVLVTKHHDGFCLWNSKYTDYDIGNPNVKTKTDIVKAVSKACHKYHIAFSVYYSLWDRHEPCYKDPDKHKYIEYMKNQLGELMKHYGKVSELWLDGPWDRTPADWYLQEIYDYVKKLQPQCQIATNCTIGKQPAQMQENDTIKYFPSDFRLFDPYLPSANDPKLYIHEGKKYYLPFEATQTISTLGSWFYHPYDKTVRDLSDLKQIFYAATTNDNCLLLNIPPDPNGDQNPLAIKRIIQLAKDYHFDELKPFPKHLKKPHSLLDGATATTIGGNDPQAGSPMLAIDADVTTAWSCKDTTGCIEIQLKKPTKLQTIKITEGGHSVKNFVLQIFKNGQWTDAYKGSQLCKDQPTNYGLGIITFSKKIKTDRIRFQILSAKSAPSIYSIRLE